MAVGPTYKDKEQMNFSTYGPFKLPTSDWDAIDILYDEFRAAHPKLDKGIGIYLIACRDKSGKLKPWYVGRTHKSLGSRLYAHFKDGKFTELIEENRGIEIFLLPRVTSKGDMIRSTDKVRAHGLKSIKLLEFIFIGSCLPQNPELLNKQEHNFHSSMHVPGFWNSSTQNYDDAASQLASMLDVKFGYKERENVRSGR